ncbi:MAG: aspartate carbamoyltransferase catalytic subunit [Alphaproteobacteria bacterium]|nr:aspartate carbamoyltransferase catalytic subunit [Alphaproteobacteria bacterium]MDA7983511.1 aspartate carbamoyltransferase catalytic subunit [Alphaproteobacteria bacterium]MDA7988014.1 aspartate carbamoyltransferase catalytic subunit [Alphaproteobacteria bacterium]MDA8002100.1 aspartate carbamoyltransferase catalytic subunit [Alphaproteobacteria bacterium]MDA8003284.1 aspartate carbamoyltransferase catalytic subunit [Alphaproteobacteria bacterium]
MPTLTPAARNSHLLGINGLSANTINSILDKAARGPSADKPLAQKVVVNLFFENSTRTRTSFEISAFKLGADVVNISTRDSSIAKGETLLDTALTLNAYKPAVLIVRHPNSGAVDLLAQKVNCSTINAGDGQHEHPTQALLDALTIQQSFGTLRGLKVALCGDVLHSRVARSNYHLLDTMGAEVRLVGPDTLLPSAAAMPNAQRHLRLEDGLKNIDVVMMLRLQVERMKGNYFPSVREYYHFWGLTPDRLRVASKGALVLHPGPMNRGVEIGSEVADDIKRSAIVRQLENGIAVRCACLEMVTGSFTPEQ